MNAELAGKKILVVDDEPDLREILKDSLEFAGAEVLEADSGTDAFKKIASTQYDAVVSDIRMPGGDGISLAKNVAAMQGKKPVLLLVTGFADILPSEAYDMGVHGFIFKPFKLETIINTLWMSFASDETRWTREVKSVIKNLNVTGEISALVSSKRIQIGSGGIFIGGQFEVRLNEFVRLQLDNDIGIVGIARWVNHDTTKGAIVGIGIEFYNLSDSARKFFSQKIQELRPKAFIPRG